MFLAPDAKLDDGLLDVVLIAQQSKLAYLRGLPRVFKGTHLDHPAVTLLQGREVTFERGPAVHGVCRRRPDRRAAGDGPGAAGRAAGGGAAMMRLAAGVAAAKAVGTLARTAGRGGGTSLPGKVLTRVEPHAIGRLAQRLDRGSVVISATNGKTTTAAMVASILERTGARLVHNRAGRTWPAGSPARWPAPRARAAAR